jgi:hypothetical protein
MATIAQQSVWDDAAGTIAADYEPVNVVGNVATWKTEENTSAGSRVATYSFDARTAKRATDKIRFKLAIPKEVLVDGTYRVVGVAYVNIDATLPDVFVEADRQVVMSNMINWISGSTDPLYKGIVHLESIY